MGATRYQKRITYYIGGGLLLALFVLLSAASLLSRCGGPERTPGYMYLALKENPSSLDPAHVVSVDAGSVAAKLFNGLVRFNTDLVIVPDIAESWTLSEDARTYAFQLRGGVKFSSGREVKAQDFKNSFERVLDPDTGSPSAWVFEQVEGAHQFMERKADEVSGFRVLGPDRFEIVLKEPFSPFLGLLTMPAAYVVPYEQVLLKGRDFGSEPLGTGPFVLREWLPNRHLRLARSDNYFDTPPKAEGLVYRIIPEELTSVVEFELGNIDALNIPASAFRRYMEDDKWKPYVSSMEALNTYYLGLNCQRPPFDDPEVRRALNYAIDRKKILSTLFEGRGKIASGPVPEPLRSWAAPEPYPYDPVRARKIIEQKGLRGRTLHFYIKDEQQMQDLAEVVQAYLKEVGLEVRLVRLEWSAFKDAVNRGEPDLFWLSWWADYADPENFLFPLFHSANHGPLGNRVWYTNHTVDALIKKGQHAPTRKARDAYYSEAERLIVSEAPWVFFWHRTDYVVRQPSLRNLSLYPVYTIDKGTEISYNQ